MASFISCPSCKKPIALDEVYSQQVREQLQKEYDASKSKLEEDFTRKNAALATEKQQVNQVVEKRVADETAKARQEAEHHANQKIQLERELEKKELTAIKAQALEAKEREMNALQKVRTVEEQQQKLELEKKRALQEIESQKQQLALEKEGLQQVVEQRVASERTILKAQAQQEADKKAQEQSKALQMQVEELQSAAGESRTRELEALKKVRQADEKIQSLNLEVQRKVAEELEKVRQQTLQTLQEEQRLKDLQSDREKEALRKTIDELKRRMDQGSQQAQGEVLEIDLEETLKAAFPADKITEVPKGQKGADVLQRIYNSMGKHCGTILWESKRTKAWSEPWLSKLKDDQAAVNAEAAILMTMAMPKGHTTFTEMGGVVVTSYSCYLPVGAALRRSIIHVANAKSMATAGNETKELVYNYMTSNAFMQHVRAILDVFKQMEKQTSDEKVALNKQWAAREKMAQKALLHIAGLYGDLQGLAGASIPTIDGLEVKALASPEEEKPDDQQDIPF